jgi:uncharacterized protein (DUF488 family)
VSQTREDVADRTLWTIGHSNIAQDEFIDLLKLQSIELLADVRRLPGSRRWPHFNSDALAAGLAVASIEYRHFPQLGGRRSKRRAGSPNTGWRVEAFNAYADYAETAEFGESIAELTTVAEQKRTAIMCAEALPWRCHRRIIADLFVARGWRVLDIIGRKVKEHVLPDFARVVGGDVIYPGGTLFE